MSPEPWDIATALVLVLLSVAALEIGLAFLMRGQRESSSPDD